MCTTVGENACRNICSIGAHAKRQQVGVSEWVKLTTTIRRRGCGGVNPAPQRKSAFIEPSEGMPTEIGMHVARGAWRPLK